MTNALHLLGTYVIGVNFPNEKYQQYYAGRDHDNRMIFGQEYYAKYYKTQGRAKNQLKLLRLKQPFPNATYDLRKVHFNRQTLQFEIEPCPEQ